MIPAYLKIFMWSEEQQFLTKPLLFAIKTYIIALKIALLGKQVQVKDVLFSNFITKILAVY